MKSTGKEDAKLIAKAKGLEKRVLNAALIGTRTRKQRDVVIKIARKAALDKNSAFVLRLEENMRYGGSDNVFEVWQNLKQANQPAKKSKEAAAVGDYTAQIVMNLYTVVSDLSGHTWEMGPDHYGWCMRPFGDYLNYVSKSSAKINKERQQKKRERFDSIAEKGTIADLIRREEKQGLLDKIAKLAKMSFDHLMKYIGYAKKIERPEVMIDPDFVYKELRHGRHKWIKAKYMSGELPKHLALFAMDYLTETVDVPQWKLEALSTYVKSQKRVLREAAVGGIDKDLERLDRENNFSLETIAHITGKDTKGRRVVTELQVAEIIMAEPDLFSIRERNNLDALKQSGVSKKDLDDYLVSIHDTAKSKLHDILSTGSKVKDNDWKRIGIDKSGYAVLQLIDLYSPEEKSVASQVTKNMPMDDFEAMLPKLAVVLRHQKSENKQAYSKKWNEKKEMMYRPSEDFINHPGNGPKPYMLEELLDMINATKERIEGLKHRRAGFERFLRGDYDRIKALAADGVFHSGDVKKIRDFAFVGAGIWNEIAGRADAVRERYAKIKKWFTLTGRFTTRTEEGTIAKLETDLSGETDYEQILSYARRYVVGRPVFTGSDSNKGLYQDFCHIWAKRGDVTTINQPESKSAENLTSVNLVALGLIDDEFRQGEKYVTLASVVKNDKRFRDKVQALIDNKELKRQYHNLKAPELGGASEAVLRDLAEVDGPAWIQKDLAEGIQKGHKMLVEAQRYVRDLENLLDTESAKVLDRAGEEDFLAVRVEGVEFDDRKVLNDMHNEILWYVDKGAATKYAVKKSEMDRIKEKVQRLKDKGIDVRLRVKHDERARFDTPQEVLYDQESKALYDRMKGDDKCYVVVLNTRVKGKKQKILTTPDRSKLDRMEPLEMTQQEKKEHGFMKFRLQKPHFVWRAYSLVPKPDAEDRWDQRKVDWVTKKSLTNAMEYMQEKNNLDNRFLKFQVFESEMEFREYMKTLGS